MNEEQMLDELARAQEATDPRGDIASRIAACREGLLKGLITIPDAQRVFGPEVLDQVLPSWPEMLHHSAREDRLRVAVAASSTIDSDRRSQRHQAWAVAFAIGGLVLAGIGLFAATGHLHIPGISAGTSYAAPVRLGVAGSNADIIYEIRKTRQVDSKIKDQIRELAAKHKTEKLQDQEVVNLLSKMEKLEKEISDKLIALEVQKRYLDEAKQSDEQVQNAIIRVYPQFGAPAVVGTSLRE